MGPSKRFGPRRQASALVGGPSGPTLLFRIAATRPKSVGPEGPATQAKTVGP
ncbi:DUF6053 domain-containing protein [Lysobacter enzymogenes]|uniref:DUF6053 domain-containing protein n=1 Tax=Lysobacter enzymogenes TaxID=69 RepID=UPI00374A0DD8